MDEELKELIEDLDTYGFDDTIEEFFGESIEKSIPIPQLLELGTKSIIKKLKEKKKSDKEITTYLYELQEGDIKSISGYEMECKPYGFVVYIEFEDGLKIKL